MLKAILFDFLFGQNVNKPNKWEQFSMQLNSSSASLTHSDSMSFGFREQFWQSLILFYPWVNICRASLGDRELSIVNTTHTYRQTLKIYSHLQKMETHVFQIQKALKLIHDLKLWLVMSSSCDNSELVPVPGFGFIPACIRNNIDTQYQVSSTLSLVNIESNSSHWLITHSLLSTHPNIVIMLLLQAYKTSNVKICA